jgi:hypothetical protein
MHDLDPSPALVAAGTAALVLDFVAREIASGALREAGKDLWRWLKRAAR